MSQIWKEKYNPKIHFFQMGGAGWGGEYGEPWDGMYVDEDFHGHAMHGHRMPEFVYLCSVCGFTFTFMSRSQVMACLTFYRKKHLESGRAYLGAADNWEVQTWYQRLPGYLRKENKRKKVIQALELTLKLYDKAHQG